MNTRKPQSILVTLASVSIVLLLIVAIFNSQSLQNLYQQYSRAVDSKVILADCSSLFQTIRHYGFERGRVNVVLNFKGPNAKMQSSIDFLRHHKNEGDRELKKTLDRIMLQPQYKKIPQIKQIIATQKEINLLRNKYEEELLLPFKKRDSQLDDIWFDTMSKHIQQIKILLFSIEQKNDWLNEQEYYAQAFSLLSQLRDHAGPVASYLKAASFNVNSLTEKRIGEINFRKLQVQSYLEKMVFISSQMTSNEPYEAVVEFKHHYIDVFYPLAQRYMNSLQSGATNPQLEKNYLSVAVVALEKLNNVGSVLEKSYASVSKKIISRQLTNLWVGIIASVSSFLIILYSLYLLYRRVYLRVICSAHAMDQLAHGNIDIDIKPPEIPDEIGAIEAGLENFRDNLHAIVDKNAQLKVEIDERIAAELERDNLEIELRQKHKMEAVGFMAGGMAHNFNNNLSIILGNVELSQMKQVPGSEVIPLLENAKIAVRRSRDLVQKIITYSRKGITHKAPMWLTIIIDETLGLVTSTLPATVTLHRSVDPDCKTRQIYADASQIQEVLINLCNNAVQAMDEKGELNISLEPVELEQKNIPAQYDCLPGQYVKLSVKDSGCGMPTEMLDKIFDPFYTTKEEYEGAGMGLATVQGIVAQHGGMIKVDSQLDHGTTFDLYFPIIEQKDMVEPVAEMTALSRGTECILFVDDDEILASLGEQLLSTLGYQVCMMTDSTEALKMFTANANRFDLVITDQTMPKLTGKELIEEIKKVKADIPTILCTGYSSKVDEAEAVEFGISAFMMKPLDLPQLSQTIRQVLGGEKKTNFPG